MYLTRILEANFSQIFFPDKSHIGDLACLTKNTVGPFFRGIKRLSSF